MNKAEFFLDDAIESIDEVLASGGSFKISPRGTSMLPLIAEGRDTVVIQRNTLRPPSQHDIVFYKRADGPFVLHRVMRIAQDGTYIMCGDNQTVLEEGISREQIIGYVSSIIRKGKKLKMESGGYVLYVFWWCKMPVRKLLLPFVRVKRKIVRITKRIFWKRS